MSLSGTFGSCSVNSQGNEACCACISVSPILACRLSIRVCTLHTKALVHTHPPVHPHTHTPTQKTQFTLYSEPLFRKPHHAILLFPPFCPRLQTTSVLVTYFSISSPSPATSPHTRVCFPSLPKPPHNLSHPALNINCYALS